MGRKKSKKSESDSSGEESSASSSSSEDLDLARVSDEGPRRHQGEDQWKRKPKLICPTFDRSDPVTWLNRVEQFFDLHEIEKDNKVRYAAFYLEGKANVWWQWLGRVYRKKGRRIWWKIFKKELIIRFGPSEYTNYDEALAHIRQNGTLREYQKEFERLASRVYDWPEKALVGAFIGGLKNDLAAEVRVFRPKTYAAAVDIARLRDDHLQAMRKQTPYANKRSGPTSFENRSMGGGVDTTSGTTQKVVPMGVKRLPWDELRKRREKGLCFNCDEKFTPGHRCRVKQVYLIEPTDMSDDEKESKNLSGRRGCRNFSPCNDECTRTKNNETRILDKR